jgi:cytochrome c-type biogenesis protein
MITLLALSLVAGVLTVAAPCILPLLPVIIGGSLIGGQNDIRRQWVRPLVIATSLAVSVIVFSLLIKTTTLLLGVPQQVWQIASGVLVLIIGVHYLWPQLWERFSASTGLFSKSNITLGRVSKQRGLMGAVLIGAALGPVFSSCSPTYALIVATILPVSFSEGLLYLAAYAVGMSATLLLVAYVGQAFTSKLQWVSRPGSWFTRVVAVLFILVGVMVIFGFDKAIQAFVLEQGWYDPISNLEKQFKN